MKLSDLSNIKINFTLEDLQNIDWTQVKDRALARPDIIIDVVLIAATIYATIFIYSGRKIQSQLLNSEQTKLEEKLAVAEEINGAKKRINEFIEGFPESMPSERIIDKLSEYAVNRNIQILSFSPVDEKSNEFVKLSNVRLNISSNSYENILFFIQDIENAKFAWRVENWSGTLDAQRTMRSSEPDAQNETFINASLDIGALTLIYNKNEN